MRKFRLFLALASPLALLTMGLWLFPRHQDREAFPAVPAPTPSRPSGPSASLASGSIAAPTSASPAILAQAPPRTQAALSIDGLLSDSSLDNKTVMAGLVRIILDSNREPTERSEAMSHLLNLSVEDPAPVLLPLVINPGLPDSLCNQILDDSLNDPLPWQADAHLAALIHRETKDIQEKAREHLTFLVGTDYGDNLAEWTKAVNAAKAKWAEPAN